MSCDACNDGTDYETPRDTNWELEVAVICLGKEKDELRALLVRWLAWSTAGSRRLLVMDPAGDLDIETVAALDRIQPEVPDAG